MIYLEFIWLGCVFSHYKGFFFFLMLCWIRWHIGLSVALAYCTITYFIHLFSYLFISYVSILVVRFLCMYWNKELNWILVAKNCRRYSVPHISFSGWRQIRPIHCWTERCWFSVGDDEDRMVRMQNTLPEEQQNHLLWHGVCVRAVPCPLRRYDLLLNVTSKIQVTHLGGNVKEGRDWLNGQKAFMLFWL